MKKKLIIIAVLLCCFAIFSGCGVASILENGNSYGNSWAVTDISLQDREDLTGALEDDNGTQVWVARQLSLAQIGYIDELMLKHSGVTLEQGLYRFSVNISIDNNKIPTEMNHPENDMVAQLRVIDDASQKAIASQEIYRWDFKNANAYEAQSLVFGVSEKSSVTLEVKYFSKGTMKIKDFSVTGAKATDAIIQDYESIFFDSTEDSMEYSADSLYYFDLYEYMLPVRNSVYNYDLVNLIATLQGLVNRDGQHLFIRFNAPNEHSYDQDNFWLDYLQGEGKLLEGKQVVEVKAPGTLLRLFADCYNGLAVWDESVPATVNVAATACGVENLLPVRYKAEDCSMYDILVNGLKMEIKLDLTDMFHNGGTGNIEGTNIPTTKSAKNDAYRWALEKYLKPHKTNQTILALFLDAYSWDKSGKTVSYYNIQQQLLANRDYYIANKVFFFDLSVWGDEAPNDDRQQPVGTDLETFNMILREQNSYADGELTTIGGFFPWWIKYTDKATFENKHADVESEWEHAKLYGTYYVVKDADAYGYTSIANCSIYSQSPLKEKYEQTAVTDQASVEERAAQYIDQATGKVKARNYVLQYMGDYDSAAWLAMVIPAAFSDPNRGNMPLAWPVNAVPAARFPVVYDFMYENATPNDYFTGDHNGYGYIDLMTLTSATRDAALKGGLEDYAERSHEFWDQFSLDTMCMLCLTSDGDYSDELKQFVSDLAPRGVVLNRQGDYNNVVLVTNSEGVEVPWTTEHDLGFDPPIEIAQDFGMLFSTPTSQPVFKMLRSICFMPTKLEEIMRYVDINNPTYKVTTVDPYVYFYLAQQYKLNGGIAE